MKKIYLLFILGLLSMVASAEDIEINGIKYNLISKAKEAEVIKSDNYSGDIVIPESVFYEGTTFIVTSIGSGAFANSENVTSVIIPNNVTVIGESAFSHTKKIKSITLPNSIKTIGNYAFQDSGIETIKIPNNVQAIGHHAFSGCLNLISIDLPDNNPYYDYAVFSECEKLESVKIPEGKTAIEQAMFYGCKSLKSISIPSSVETIGYGAFQNCIGFTDFTIPDGVKELKREAFAGCKGIKKFTLGAGMTNIGYETFANCDNLSDIICYATNPPITDKTAFNGSYPQYITLHVKSTSIDKYKEMEPWNSFGHIKEINDEPINTNQKSYYDIEINGIRYNLIGKAKEAEVIKSDNYSGDIVIPESVFYEGTTFIVTSIGSGAFANSENVTSVIIPNNVTVIGESAFFHTKKIKSITLPNSIKTFGNYAFQDSGIETIKIPNSVQAIGHHAFSGCLNLISIDLPDNNPYYDYAVFSECEKLESVKIPEGKTAIEQAMFYGCKSLKSISIPSSVETIGYGAFQNCIGFTDFTIPDGVKELKREAFAGCKGIKKFTLGAGMTNIGYETFANCDNLSDIICYATNPPITDKTAFNGSYPQYMTLHVKSTSIDKYKEMEPWSGFGKIQGIQDADGINSIINDAQNARIYNMRGNRLDNLQKGVNIIRTENGSVKKIMIK